jgi:hypothetical protein
MGSFLNGSALSGAGSLEYDVSVAKLICRRVSTGTWHQQRESQELKQLLSHFTFVKWLCRVIFHTRRLASTTSLSKM